MYRVLFLSHGELAVELLKAAELILGEQPANEVQAISLRPGMNMEAYQASIESFVDGTEKWGGVLIFTDIAGGSPFITAAQVYRKYAERVPMDVITGMNLPMAIEILSNRETAELEEACQAALAEGEAGIQVFSQAVGVGDETA